MGEPFYLAPRDFEAVTRQELGTKRLCAHCGAKFYDINRSPITCPKCGTFEAVPVVRGAPKPRAPLGGIGPAATQAAQFVAPKDANAKALRKSGEAPEAGDEVELDDDDRDDAVLISESEDEDTGVHQIIGGDVDIKEGS
jgi:uncharacterized protein (TIGR02300 family)